MIQGLIGGIKQMAANVAQAARDVVTNAINAAKSVLGISSPSRVFMEIGAHTGAGLALGLASSGDGVSRAARNLADRVSMSARQRLSASAVGSSTPDPDALASAVRGALHGARLDLGPVSAITDRVWATLDLAQSREAVYS